MKSTGFSLIGAGIPVSIVGQPAKQSGNGATLATITPGNWTLANQSQDLASLSTDPSKANKTVDPFDIDKLKAQQQSAAALSALLNMGVGELSERLGFVEGSPEKVALHAAVGAIVSQLAGSNVGAGALSGALSEIANGVLQQVLQADPNLTDTQKSAITQWVAAAVGAAVGGGAGAAAALDNVNYNYLTHKEAKELELAELACRGGSKTDCERHDQLLDLSQARDDQLKSCVGNSSSECVRARTDLRIAAAQYVDAALTGDGEYVTPIGGLQRQWALLQAYDYADDSDLGQIADADRIASNLKSDEAKALLTASKSGLSAALRSEILYGVVTLGQNATSGKGPATGRGSSETIIDEIASSNAPPVKPLVNPATNLASEARTNHILYGDGPNSGGHLWPGQPGKTVFPKSWNADKVMSTISDIATDPALSWKPQTGSGGLFTKSGKPARFVVTDANGNLPIVDGVPVRVVIEPAGEGIITAFPQY
ncbi:EndoU domain-containing protein [Rhizobium sp. A22-96]